MQPLWIGVKSLTVWTGVNSLVSAVWCIVVILMIMLLVVYTYNYTSFIIVLIIINNISATYYDLSATYYDRISSTSMHSVTQCEL